MSRRNRPHRLFPALALVLTTALGAGLAAPAHARPAAPRGSAVQGDGEPFSALWAALRQLWEGRSGGGSAGHALRSLTGAEGASLDPHGGSPSNGTGTGTAPAPGDGSH